MTEKDDRKRKGFTGGLVVVSGPSGSGKTTICKRICSHESVTMAVSATTRPRRLGEVDGKDYIFMSDEEFRAGIDRGDFVEYNEVFADGYLYGSLKSELEKGISDLSRYYLMEIDVRGALNLRELDYEGRYIFISPPSMQELRSRLEGRRTEKEKDIAKRLEKAKWEMEQVERYDKIVINGDLEKAVGEAEEYLGLHR